MKKKQAKSKSMGTSHPKGKVVIVGDKPKSKKKKKVSASSRTGGIKAKRK